MILVEAHNVIKGGGVNVVLSFLSYLVNIKEEFLVVLPDTIQYRKYAYEKNINVIWETPDWNRYISKIFKTKRLKRIIDDHNITKLFSFGNIAYKTQVPQVLLIQNAYITLEDDLVWERMSLTNRYYLKFMKWYILKNINHADKIFVQTETIRTYLEKSFHVKNILVAPNVIDVSELGDKDILSNYLRDGVLKLLFLSKYYPHKNFEILPSLCELINKKSLPVKITLTLDINDKTEKRVLDSLKNFSGIIQNIGPVDYSELRNIYQMHNAIFLPSLLESFSSNYIEAQYFNRFILTSDRAFAREVCGDQAIYFDPNSPSDILEKIEFLILNFVTLKEANKNNVILKNCSYSICNSNEVNSSIFLSI